jgi:uncharacterized protein (TIGR00255 family)
LEQDFKEVLRSKLSRGTLNINIQRNATTADTSASVLPVFEQSFEALTEIKKRFKLKDAIKLEDILTYARSFNNAPQQSTNDISEEEMGVIMRAFEEAVEQLNQMRIKEGKELSRDLFNRVKTIEKHLIRIEQLSQERVPTERNRLRERIARLFESDEIDEQRLEMEIVFIADKLDVSEECVRLRSHIKFFIETLKSNEQGGRKINFLLQEMHREINTIGSKANDTAIAHLSVAVKEELERIREQIQNVE